MPHSFIDIGSNSVRLMLGCNSAINNKTIRTTQLCEAFASNKLTMPAMMRTVGAVHELIGISLEKGYIPHLFATAAVRMSTNGKDFVAMVKDATGYDVEVIDGATEAKLAFMGAAKSGICSAVIDLGGASCELAVGTNEPQYKRSYAFGAVSLRDEFRADYNGIMNKVISLASDSCPPSYDALIGIGGTITTLAAIKLGLSAYDPLAVHGTNVTADEILIMANKYLQIDVRTQFPFIDAKRASTVAQGAYGLYTLMRIIGSDSITVSERDNLEGYAMYLGLQNL